MRERCIAATGAATKPVLAKHRSTPIMMSKYSLNQGWDRIRFLQPLRTDSRIRARSKLLGVEERPDGSLRVEVEFRIEVEGSDKPWLTGVKVGRFFFD